MLHYLFDTSPFANHPGWSPEEIVVASASYAVIGLALLLLPIVLLYHARTRLPRFYYNRQLMVGCSALASCGLLQLATVLTFAWPMYRLTVFTAVICAFAVFTALTVLVPALPKFMNLYTHAEVEAIQQRHREAEKELRHSKNNLAQQLELRGQLEEDVRFLRALQLAQATKADKTHECIERLDEITANLQAMLTGVGSS